MKLWRLHRWTMVASLTTSTFGVMGGSDWLFLAGSCLIALLVLRSGYLLNVKRSKAWTYGTHGATVLILLALIRLFATERIDAVLMVVMLGIANRFVLHAGQRDDFLLLAASGVLMTMSTTITPGAAFGLLLLIYVPSVLWGLLASQLIFGAETMTRGEALGAPLPLRQIAERPVPPRLLRMAVWGVSLMVAGFLLVSLFPRYNFGRYLSVGYFMALPGASDNMALNTGGVPSFGDGDRILRVEPSRAASGSIEGLYARLYVLDQFDGRTWSGASERHRLRPLPMREPYEGDLADWSEGDEARSAVRITLERVEKSHSRPIAAVGYQRPAPVSPTGVSETQAGTWMYYGTLSKGTLVYKAFLRDGLDASSLSSDDRARFLRLPPELDPRVMALADRLTSGLSSDSEKVDRLTGFFGSAFKYSTAPLSGQSQDPLIRFLFEAKEGHCELYAGALTVLLRAAGVPARVATGYYGGRWNALGGYLEMTTGDAHAWTEVYLEGRGWVWADATPPDLRAAEGRRTESWFADLRDLVEKIWFENVLDFDEAKRRALVANLRSELSSAWHNPLEFFGAGNADATGTPGRRAAGAFGFTNVFGVLGALGVFGVLAALVVAVGLGGLLVRAIIRWIRRQQTRRPMVLGQRLRTILGEAPGENVTLSRLVERLPEPHQATARAVVSRYECLRFGPPEQGMAQAQAQTRTPTRAHAPAYATRLRALGADLRMLDALLVRARRLPEKNRRLHERR